MRAVAESLKVAADAETKAAHDIAFAKAQAADDIAAVELRSSAEVAAAQEQAACDATAAAARAAIEIAAAKAEADAAQHAAATAKVQAADDVAALKLRSAADAEAAQEQAALDLIAAKAQVDAAQRAVANAKAQAARDIAAVKLRSSAVVAAAREQAASDAAAARAQAACDIAAAQEQAARDTAASKAQADAAERAAVAMKAHADGEALEAAIKVAVAEKSASDLALSAATKIEAAKSEARRARLGMVRAERKAASTAAAAAAEIELEKRKVAELELAASAPSALEPHTRDCAYYAGAVSLMRSLCDDSAHPHIVSELFDWDHDRGSRCFCDACFAARSESACCSRGPPGEEIEYEVPKGWARIALQSGRRGTAGMFGSWHPAYHGTSIEGVGAILATGQLARAGDSVISGPHGTKVLKLGVRPGHIKAPFPRTNEHTGKWEMFDPHQIFVSPSFRYSELPQYARKERIAGQEMQFMVRVHMAPGSFAVGQETVGASRRISPGIPNESLEWYTKGDTKGAILIDSLCVKLL